MEIAGKGAGILGRFPSDISKGILWKMWYPISEGICTGKNLKEISEKSSAETINKILDNCKNNSWKKVRNRFWSNFWIYP